LVVAVILRAEWRISRNITDKIPFKKTRETVLSVNSVSKEFVSTAIPRDPKIYFACGGNLFPSPNWVTSTHNEPASSYPIK
jgi:hypothetical protein